MTCVGQTPEAVYSSLWALIDEGIIPLKVHLLYTKSTREHLERLEEAIKVIMEPHASVIAYDEVDEVDIESISGKVKDLISMYKSSGLAVVVDITPGRKTMSIAVFIGALEGQADLVTYLHLMKPAFEGKLYPLIPRSLIKLVNVRGSKPKAAAPKELDAAEHDDFVEVSCDELYVFLNEMFRYSGRYTMSIKVPYLDVKLLTLSLEGLDPRIDFVISSNEFHDRLRKLNIKLDEASLPFNRDSKSIYTLFKDALIASGALKLDVQGLVDVILDKIRSRLTVYIALDTNMLYTRFMTGQLLSRLDSWALDNIKVLVSRAVIMEALYPITQKVEMEALWREERSRISNLAWRTSGLAPWYLDDKAAPLRARLSRMALMELEDIKLRMETVHASRMGDMEIIRSYKDSNQSPIFITADKNALQAALALNLEAYEVNFDVEVKRENIEVTYLNLPRLILSLATMLTTISIEVPPNSGRELIVLGSWNKMMRAWRKATIKVKAPNPVHSRARNMLQKIARISYPNHH